MRTFQGSLFEWFPQHFWCSYYSTDLLYISHIYTHTHTHTHTQVHVIANYFVT